MSTRYTIHATVTEAGQECVGITFCIDKDTEAGALLWCRVAMQQLGYKLERFTLEVQNAVRMPKAWAIA